MITTEIITIYENTSVKEAAEIMNLNEIVCLVAAIKGKAVGIITERDFLKRVNVNAKSAKKGFPKSFQRTWKLSHTTRTWNML
ncbi:MAG: CBS domain-containing protein [Candidatus Bathyarchaeia archaeon]|nr:CBS domain-containing protein [Candidatus Bathyarchaeia archaeon]